MPGIYFSSRLMYHYLIMKSFAVFLCAAAVLVAVAVAQGLPQPGHAPVLKQWPCGFNTTFNMTDNFNGIFGANATLFRNCSQNALLVNMSRVRCTSVLVANSRSNLLFRCEVMCAQWHARWPFLASFLLSAVRDWVRKLVQPLLQFVTNRQDACNGRYSVFPRSTSSTTKSHSIVQYFFNESFCCFQPSKAKIIPPQNATAQFLRNITAFGQNGIYRLRCWAVLS